jgi:DNA-directed RNA polymerase subunit omega
MARVSIEDCLHQIDNRFAVVTLAASRTRQLMDGEEPLIRSKNKVAVTALREIAEGYITTELPEELAHVRVAGEIQPRPAKVEEPVAEEPEAKEEVAVEASEEVAQEVEDADTAGKLETAATDDVEDGPLDGNVS